MNKFTVRFAGGNYANSGSSIFLDKPDGTAIQLSHSFDSHSRLRQRFSAPALDLVYLALSVYGCDRAISRESTADGWTRDFWLTLPVHDLDVWEPVKADVERLVGFLTGDTWQISFVRRERLIFDKSFQRASRRFRNRTRVGGSTVSLFSGGMDSLIGVVDWLETNPAKSITLSGCYDPDAEPAADDQRELLVPLQAAYPKRIFKLTSRMGIKGEGLDRNYRSRSFCFLAFGILSSEFLEDSCQLLVPENGPIALNYPLAPSRSGSLSTRTVHPYLLSQLSRVVAALGIECEISNPYAFDTKGEMILNCRNQDLLKKVYLTSVSCGNRKMYKVNVPGATAKQCGFCVPCLFRRAALHRAGWPSGPYGVIVENVESWGRLRLSEPNTNYSDVCDFVQAHSSDREIWRNIIANGSVPLADKAKYIDLVKRQRLELHNWMAAAKSR